jgi:hypothetical protein
MVVLELTSESASTLYVMKVKGTGLPAAAPPTPSLLACRRYHTRMSKCTPWHTYNTNTYVLCVRMWVLICMHILTDTQQQAQPLPDSDNYRLASQNKRHLRMAPQAIATRRRQRVGEAAAGAVAAGAGALEVGARPLLQGLPGGLTK